MPRIPAAPILACVALASSTLPLAARDEIPPEFWGVWGVSKEECADDEGPNFNTVIAPDGIEQYENHCKVRSAKPQGTATVATLACEAEAVHDVEPTVDLDADRRLERAPVPAGHDAADQRDAAIR